MSWSIEEYLIYVLDYFEDYTGAILLLGYDLRIDAYVDYRITPIKDYKILDPGLLKITRKAKREMTESSEAHIEFDLERVPETSLNPIEAAHFQKFNSTHGSKILEVGEKGDKKLKLCLGKIEKINSYQSPIYENSFELIVSTSDLDPTPVILLTQDKNYKIGDQVCFLVRTSKDHLRILGLKPRESVSDYLDRKKREQKNNELNLVEIP